MPPGEQAVDGSQAPIRGDHEICPAGAGFDVTAAIGRRLERPDHRRPDGDDPSAESDERDGDRIDLRVDRDGDRGVPGPDDGAGPADLAEGGGLLLHDEPASGEVRDAYDFGGGEFVLDLSAVSDVDALDGRDITIDGVGGQVEVVVPDGVDVAVRTEVVAGDSRVFDERNDGFDITLAGFRDGGTEVPDMTITIDLVAGEVIVREAA